MPDILHISSCPVCNSQELNSVIKANDWLVTKEEFSIYECASCEFRFTQDAPSEALVGPYYDNEDYVEHSDSSKGLIFTLYHWGRKLMLNRKHNLIANNSQGKRLLDVGSASGYFLNHMKQKGFDVQGIEISEKARELCKSKFDIDTFTPNLLINKELDGPYDVITLWHVFEHVYTYNEYFDAFKELLSPDGVLVIAMPNYKCYDAAYYKEYWNGYDVPRHLWHFHPPTFNTFSEKRGFKTLKTKRLPLDPIYNSLVSADYKPRKAFLGLTLLVGVWSYLISLINKQRSSSLVYFLKKNN